MADADADARTLERLGYAQQLARRLGGFSSFAIGFSVISVLTGVTSTFGDALSAGGPAGLGIGWLVVAGGTIFVALAMAELASAFPTSGALYHWAALLGGPFWGWCTAMLNLVGQIAIIAAIDLACARAIAQILGGGAALAYGLFAAVVVAHGALNAWSVHLVVRLNDASVMAHVAGVVVLASWLCHAGFAHPIGYLASAGRAPAAHGGYAVGFTRSLVLGVWTFTGFDAAAHVSEETHAPERRAPRAILSAVAVSVIAGFALVATLTLSIRDEAAAAGSPDAALQVLRAALGPDAGRAAMGLVAVAMWFAGLSSVTSASRMLFAFARDGGVPKATVLCEVDPRTRTPLYATAACVVLPLALVGAVAPLSDAVFLAAAALATVALYASYVLPIALGAIARTKGRWTRCGTWNLGRAGVAVAWAAVGWTGVVGVVCALANGAALGAFTALVVLLAIEWHLRARKRFVGPKVDLAQLQRG